MMTATFDEEDHNNSSSNSSEQQQQHKYFESRKRKATEDMSEAEMAEAALKRKKNREAAKKCRERRHQQTEDLREKNEQLETENCELVRQRDELRQRCDALEEKLRKHKMDGCLLSEFDPSCTDLGHILDPATPPPPSFAGSHTPSPCPSPVSSVSVASPGYAMQSYKIDPTPMKSIDDSRRTVAHGRSNAMTNQVKSQIHNSQMMLTELGEAKESTVPFLSIPQQISDAEQGHPQLYSISVRDDNGCLRNLQLSREDYSKVLERMQVQKASFAKRPKLNDGVTPGYYTESRQVFSPPQMSQDACPNPISGTDQPLSTQFPGQMSMQNGGNQSRTLNIDQDWMTLTELVGDKNNYQLVNPNDVFMNNAGNETPGSGSMAFQDKLADITYTTEEEAQLFEQMFPGQLEEMILPATNVLNNASDQTLGLQHDATSQVRAREMMTITVTNPQTAQVIEQTSTLHNTAIQKFDLSPSSKGMVESTPVLQQRQPVPYVMSTADSVNLPPSKMASNNSSHDIPTLLCLNDSNLLKKPTSSFLKDAAEIRGSSGCQQLTIDSFKTLKLRPKALNGALPPAGSKPQMIRAQNGSQPAPSQSVTQRTTSITTLQNESLTSNQSKMVRFQPPSVGIMPAFQNSTAPNNTTQQQVPQAPMSRGYDVQIVQNTPVLKVLGGNNQTQEIAPLMTINTNNILDYLAHYSIEAMDNDST